MTIKNVHDYGQRHRPRVACLKKLEVLVMEMQDPTSGVKSQTQRLVITTIPHALTGEDVAAWIAKRFSVEIPEACAIGTMLVAFGYIYPLRDHKRLILKPDASLYRFQTPYFWPAQQWPVEDTDYAIYLAKKNIRKKGVLELQEQEQYNELHKWINHKWDFIVMQAKEQYRAGKERKKPDRVVFDCQERAYWVVHRPPPGTVSAMDLGLLRLVDPNAEEVKILFNTPIVCYFHTSLIQRMYQSEHTLLKKLPNQSVLLKISSEDTPNLVEDTSNLAESSKHTKTPDYFRRIIIFTEQCIMRPRVKSSVSLGAIVKYMTTYKLHDPFLAPVLPSNPWLTDDNTYWKLNMLYVENPTKMRVEQWTFSFGELLSDPLGRDGFRLFLKKEFSSENLAFWEACEDVKWGAASTIHEKAQHIYKTFLARGAPRWINIDGKTLEMTVRNLKHPHRFVLDAAQTHIYMLMKKDKYGRYIKSPVYSDIKQKAIDPQPHNFTDAQIEQNAKKRHPSLSPIIVRQQEEEMKAKLAASGPVDITQLCRFTAPIPHIAVYSGICEAQPTASPGLTALPNSAACPSPISVAIDSTPASERHFDVHSGTTSHFPSIAESIETSVGTGEEESQTPVARPRVTLSLSRLLRRGCNASSVFASLSPKCSVAAGSGRVQPLGAEPQPHTQHRRLANFFQIKVDIPPECRIYPIDSEDEQESPGSARGGMKEIICPWESITK